MHDEQKRQTRSTTDTEKDKNKKAKTPLKSLQNHQDPPRQRPLDSHQIDEHINLLTEHQQHLQHQIQQHHIQQQQIQHNHQQQQMQQLSQDHVQGTTSSQ